METVSADRPPLFHACSSSDCCPTRDRQIQIGISTHCCLARKTLCDTLRTNRSRTRPGCESICGAKHRPRQVSERPRSYRTSKRWLFVLGLVLGRRNRCAYSPTQRRKCTSRCHSHGRCLAAPEGRSAVPLSALERPRLAQGGSDPIVVHLLRHCNRRLRFEILKSTSKNSICFRSRSLVGSKRIVGWHWRRINLARMRRCANRSCSVVGVVATGSDFSRSGLEEP
jgi:hypothetical protein